ncbi:MAG: ketopantoate reductase C-terminal domain-containing protein, partial [Trebonia sp.]
VLDAAGIGYATTAAVDEARGHHVDFGPVAGAPRGGGSSWQSLTRGTGSIEADFLNGEIVLLGRENSVPTPVNEALQRLANRAAADRLPPGSLSPGEIAAAAGCRDR